MGRFQSFQFHAGFALIAALVLIFAQAVSHKVSIPTSDSIDYLHVAARLHDTGIFTDGRDHYGYALKQGRHGEGMFFAPLYPAFLAGLMAVDDGFYKTAVCLTRDAHKDKSTKEDLKRCDPLDLRIMIYAQAVLGGLAAFLAWLSGYVLTRRKDAAWLAMLIACFAGGSYVFYAGLALTESLNFPLFTAFSLAGVAGLKKKNLWLVLLSGVFLGLLTLTRPSYPFLLYFVIVGFVTGIAGDLYARRAVVFLLKGLLIFTAGYALTIAPWVVRNGIKIGEWSVCGGYGSYILAQRVSYDDMTWREWRASFVYGLPDFGDVLAEKMFPPEDYERLDYANPDGFSQRAYDVVLPETKKAAGGMEHHLGYLIKHYILAQLVWHSLVTLSLAWRGMWIGKYWGLVMIPVFLAMFVRAIREKRYDFVLFALPGWYMLGFNAFVSVNVVRYNIVMLPCLAVATALAIAQLYDGLRKKREI